MRELLLAELKRAVELMENNPEMEMETKKPFIMEGKHLFDYTERNRDIIELWQVLHMARKHSIAFEKEIRKENY
jgi:hypothetical protein